MRLFSIVGARPQFVKVAALHRAIIKKNNLQHFILHTGQHYDYNLSEIFFRELDIPKPSFHININERSLASSTSHIQKKIEDVLKAENPDTIVVFGDTNSTLAGALAAKSLHIKLAHVEAGLRSYNNSMPEEINRIETDKISDLLFCPTTQAIKNLVQEGFNNSDKKVIQSGDIMLDAFNYYSEKITDFNSNAVLPKTAFILCTLHRESLLRSAEKMKEIVKALNEINGLIPIILPAHPRLQEVIYNLHLETDFTITEPVGYLNMLALLRSCTLVLTDSGGLQKEAFFSKKICVTLRDETEWTELIYSEVNFLAGDSSSKKIVSTFNTVFNKTGNFDNKFYGDGNAAENIVEELIKECNP